MPNPGLSCVFVQGLLFPGYAYRVSALRAIPGSTLERENHLRVAYPFLPEVIILGSVVLPRIICVSQLSTDRHSLTVPQLVDISIPSAIPFDCAPGFVPNIVCLRVGARVPFCSSTTTRTSSIHSIPNSLLMFATAAARASLMSSLTSLSQACHSRRILSRARDRLFAVCLLA